MTVKEFIGVLEGSGYTVNIDSSPILVSYRRIEKNGSDTKYYTICRGFGRDEMGERYLCVDISPYRFGEWSSVDIEIDFFGFVRMQDFSGNESREVKITAGSSVHVTEWFMKIYHDYRL